MSDLIERLSELRSQYSCFDESEEPHYRALSEAIEVIREQQKIIHCRDCKWNKAENCKETTRWLPCRAIVTPSEFSCIYAERREDG